MLFRSFFSFTILWSYPPCAYVPLLSSAHNRRIFSGKCCSNSKIARDVFFPERKVSQARHTSVRLKDMSEGLPILDTCYRLYKQLYSINTSLPKAQYYRIGLSTEQSVQELIKQLVLAQNAPKLQKRTYLLQANTELELVRVKVRLYIELELANQTRLFQTSAICNDVGRMLGGWIKST